MNWMDWLESQTPCTEEPVKLLLRASEGAPIIHTSRAPWALALGVRRRHPTAFIVDASGSRDEDDLVLCIGMALDCWTPGHPGKVAEALTRRQASIVVLLSTSAPNSSTTDRLAALTPQTQWIHLVAETDSLSGTPVLHHTFEALSALPRGLPVPPTIVADDMRPTDSGRAGLVYAPTASMPPSDEALDYTTELLQEVLRLADDAPPPMDSTIADLFATRWLAEHHYDPRIMSRSAAATARLRLLWGQPAVALSTLQHTLRRLSAAPGVATACVEQASADAHARLGDTESASAAYDRAAKRLRDTSQLGLLLRFTRRRAELLLTRGQPQLARPLLRQARSLAREVGDPVSSAATLRASGDAAAAAGERLGAEALYEQAAATQVPPGEHANRMISEAALAIAQREYDRAAQLLIAVPESGAWMTQAASHHRRAELALRRKQPDRAVTEAEQATERFARAGGTSGQARSVRLLGDAHAAAGRRALATDCYAQALELQASLNDIVGARETLIHAAQLCEDAGQLEERDQLRAFAAEL